MNQLFERMSTEELEAYAQTGALPEWLRATVRAREHDSQESLIVDIYTPHTTARHNNSGAEARGDAFCLALHTPGRRPGPRWWHGG
jgi:hypothetical protein